MPYYSEQLLSSWPATMRFDVKKQSYQIPKEVLADVKTIDFVGYAANTSNVKRNQVVTQKHDKENGPKFRSEQEREKTFSRTPSKMNVNSSQDSVTTEKLPVLTDILKCYRKVSILYSKFGVEDFDFGFYNATKYGGLETHIENSYCNSILQLLFFTLPFRELCKRHIRQPCLKEFCFACELGFLFRMLEDSNGLNCQATNFLRIIAHATQANVLELIGPPTTTEKTGFAKIIQNFTRFIVDQVHQDVYAHNALKIQNTGVKTDVYPNEVQSAMGISMESVSKCMICNQQTNRTTCPFTIDLIYTKPTLASDANQFLSMLGQSISRSTSTKAWCAGCNKYTPTNQSKVVSELPYQFLVNANATNDTEVGLWHDEKCYLPESLFLSIDTDGVVQVGERECVGAVKYELTAVVDEIGFESKATHLVAHLKTDSTWTLFNDFLVEPISGMSFTRYKKWRVSADKSKITESNQNVESVKSRYTTADTHAALKMITLKYVNFDNWLIESRRKDLLIRHRPLSKTEYPSAPGYICAIDAEFVSLSKEESEIRSDGTRSTIRPSQMILARVSVLRGCGPYECVPFIDEYISTSVPVFDYLTEYSGINDLDKQFSQFPLVSLKSSHKRLRVLVDMGFIFVGHGLKSDFRILNILVPPAQIIDTVDLFFLRHKSRKLSLRFLSYILLKKEIQQNTHDSIEDAQSALELYKKYLELKENGTFRQVLEDIYERGKALNFRPPAESPAPYRNNAVDYSSPIKKR